MISCSSVSTASAPAASVTSLSSATLGTRHCKARPCSYICLRIVVKASPCSFCNELYLSRSCNAVRASSIELWLDAWIVFSKKKNKYRNCTAQWKIIHTPKFYKMCVIGKRLNSFEIDASTDLQKMIWVELQTVTEHYWTDFLYVMFRPSQSW